MPSSPPRWSFGALLAAITLATVVGVGVAVVLHILLLVPIVVVVMLVIGIVAVLTTFPKVLPAEPQAAGAADEEPFEDPVEEADRLDSSGASGKAPTEDADVPPPAGTPRGGSTGDDSE